MLPEFGYCWATTESGFRCNDPGAKAAKDYRFYFEHCYKHLGYILAADYPSFFIEK